MAGLGCAINKHRFLQFDDESVCITCLVNKNTKAEATVKKLRGQLQNCVAHLERAANRNYERDKYKAVIEQANKVLYETLER